MRSFRLIALVALSVCTLAAQTKPVPFVNDPLVPDAAPPGSSGFTLTVNGTGFAPSSVVNWNGSARATTFVSASKLTAAILAADVATAATASVTVTSPMPGGGTSNIVFFQVMSPSSAAPFTIGTSPSVSSTSYSIATGDLNGDGKLDLIVGGTAAWLLLGNGDGTFQAPQPLITASYPICVATGDFNGDGKLDIATCSYNNPDGAVVSILLGNGDGTFQPYLSSPTDFGGRAIAVGDFNRDGNVDLALASSYTGSISILLSNADGMFQPPIDIFISQGLTTVFTGDLNRDGNLDLVCGGSGGIWVLLGDGNGLFQPPVLVTSSGIPGFGAPLLNDVNGDGILDMIALGSGDVSVFLGNGDGTFEAPVNYVAGQNPVSVATGDFNGDGNIDIAVADLGPSQPKPNVFGAISLLLGNGDGTFRAAESTSVPWGLGLLAAGDFNRDGRLDLATLAPNYSPLASVYLQTSLSVSPSILLFPRVLGIGKTSAPETLEMTNSGTVPLSISQIGLTGPNASDFSVVSDTCTGSVLPASGSCALHLTVTPSVAGTLRASIGITDNAPASPQSAELIGNGTAVAFTPSKLAFGDVKVKTISDQKIVTMLNAGTSKLENIKVSVRGQDAKDFVQSDSCGSSLGPKKTCSIIVTFVPLAKGTRKATISIGDTGGGSSPQEIPLTGTGI